MSWNKFKAFANKFTWRTYANLVSIVLVVCMYWMTNMYVELVSLRSTNAQLNTSLVAADAALKDQKAVVVHARAKLKELRDSTADDQVRAEAAQYRKNTELVVTQDSLAIRNKNPMNVKRLDRGAKWKGQIGVDRFGHVIFATFEDGVRAAAKILHKYASTHGIDNIDALVERFCTGDAELDKYGKNRAKERYKTFLAARLGVDVKTKFNLMTRLPDLLSAMAKYESGNEFPMRYFRPYDLVVAVL